MMEIESLGKQTTDVQELQMPASPRQCKMEKRTSVLKTLIEEIHSSIKENIKSKKFLMQNIQKIQDTMKTPNLK